jgi:hypothetical protein
MRPRNSLKGSYEAQLGPPIIQVMAEAWGLSPPERASLWRALCRATWSETVELREFTIRFSPHQQNARAALDTTLAPPQWVACLERLVQEGVLTRACATRIEEALLRHTGPDGAWQPLPRQP